MNSWNNLLPTLLANVEHEGAAAGAEHAAEGSHEIGLHIFWFVGLAIALMMAFMILAKPGYNKRVFSNVWAQRGEQLYLFLEQFALGIIGPHGKKYMPMLATFWMFIFASNFIGLFLPYTPTAVLGTNLGLAIVAICYVQYEGIKANGLKGHLSHFVGPKMQGAMVAISGMIFLIEMISEAMKLVSLTLRLYGNIHGGHEVVVAFNKLIGFGGMVSLGHEEIAQYPVLLGGILIPIKLLTCLVQAMVFCLLLCVYLGLVTHHDEAHGEDGHGDSAHGEHQLAHA